MALGWLLVKYLLKLHCLTFSEKNYVFKTYTFNVFFKIKNNPSIGPPTLNLESQNSHHMCTKKV